MNGGVGGLVNGGVSSAQSTFPSIHGACQPPLPKSARLLGATPPGQPPRSDVKPVHPRPTEGQLGPGPHTQHKPLGPQHPRQGRAGGLATHSTRACHPHQGQRETHREAKNAQSHTGTGCSCVSQGQTHLPNPTRRGRGGPHSKRTQGQDPDASLVTRPGTAAPQGDSWWGRGVSAGHQQASGCDPESPSLCL